MKHRDDPSVIKNGEEQKKRLEKEGGIGWANNVDAQHIIAVGRKMYDGDMNKVNEVLEKKGFLKIDKRPEKGDYLYIDF